MRKLEKEKLIDLRNLTRLRKAIQTAESNTLQSNLNRKECEIQKLRSPILDDSSIGLIQDKSPWQGWRRQKILDLNTEKASIQAQLIQAQKSLGKATAEDETAKHLNKVFETQQKSKKRE